MGNSAGILKQETSDSAEAAAEPTVDESSGLKRKERSDFSSSIRRARLKIKTKKTENARAVALQIKENENKQEAILLTEITENEKVKVLEEFPELKETLVHVRKTIKNAYTAVDGDSMNKTMSLSVRRTFDDIYNYYFEFNNPIHRRMIGDQVANEGGARLLTTYMNILSNDGREYPMSGYKYACVEVLRSFAWNYTDVSMKLSDEFGRAGFLSSMYGDLQKFKLTYKENEKQGFLILSAMSVIYNCAKSSANIKYFREMDGIIDTILWYSKNSKDHPSTSLIAPLSTIILAYVVDDEQNELISADDSVITTIIHLLKGALSAGNHMQDGFTAAELVHGLTKMASHDHNSDVIMKKGVMLSLKKMLTTGNDEEKIAASKAIWVLAFNKQNKDEIRKLHQEVISVLTEIRSNSENKNLRNVATGALWLLEVKPTALPGKTSMKKKKKKTVPDSVTQKKKELSQTLPHLPDDDDDDDDDDFDDDDDDESSSAVEVAGTERKHIMISYQWYYQKLMIKIKASLEESGFRVWMDVVEMGGSTLEKMADAVERSQVVIVGLSQRYKDSVSCRTEAEYAYKCNKDVVPLLLEKNYKADGWLGAILGTKLYLDFTNLVLFDKGFPSLLKELGDRGKVPQAELEEIKATAAKSHAGAAEGKSVDDWSAEDVRKWISTQNFKSFKNRELNGHNLRFLKTLRLEAPEFFYRYLFENLNLRHLGDLKIFTEGLAELN